MTDPSSKTVRGWQVDILAALAGLGAFTTVATELSYLNRRLWGRDASGLALAPADGPSLYDAFVRKVESEFGDPELYTVIGQLLLLGGTVAGPSARDYLAAIVGSSATTATNSFDPVSGDGVGQTSAAANVILSQIRGYLFSNQGGSVADVAAAILAAIGPINETPVDLTVRGALQGISLNTLRAAECCEEGQSGGGGTVPPFDTAACEDTYTLGAESTSAFTFDGASASVTVTWQDAGPGVFDPVNIPGRPSAGAVVAAVPGVFACLQLQKADDDPGEYILETFIYNTAGGYEQVGWFGTINVPPSGGQTAAFPQLYSGDPYGLVVSVFRTENGGTTFVPWSGTQPKVYLGYLILE